MLRLGIFIVYITLVSSSPRRTEPRIIGGEEGSTGQFPWQAGLVIHKSSGPNHFCGGSIISEEWIISSAGCIEGSTAIQVYTGSVSVMDGTKSYASAIKIPEGYNSTSLANNIGLIKLSEPLTFDDDTSPINLAQDALDSGVEVFISGWGITSEENLTVSSNLNYVSLETISNYECKMFYDEAYVNDGVVCAIPETDDRGPCNGDTGGPLVSSLDSSPTLVGVLSFVSKFGCLYGKPFGFTRTASYRDWIRDYTGI